MAFEKVKKELEARGLGDRLSRHAEATETVEHAAAVIGCLPAEIAKTMGFVLDDAVLLVVAAGDGKISNAKFKARFGKKPTMIPRDRVEELTGHEPGGVCPFALPEGVRVYLDRSLLRLSVVHTAGGSTDSTVRLLPSELGAIFGDGAWVDVCNLPE